MPLAGRSAAAAHRRWLHVWRLCVASNDPAESHPSQQVIEVLSCSRSCPAVGVAGVGRRRLVPDQALVVVSAVAE